MIRLWPRAPARAALACVLLATGAAPAPVFAQDAIDNLSKRLIELRSDVESLNEKLNAAKNQHRNRMAALSRRRGEVEASIERAKLQLEEIRGQVAEARQAASKAGANAEELRPVVLDALAETADLVKARLPFKREQRLAELDQIRIRLEQDVITPHKAVNTLWAFHEDEIRLTGDNGLYQQTVRAGGKEQLADVARLGMVMMFYRTSDERYGSVVRNGGDWAYRPIESGRRDQVAELFESFQRQVRTGYFRLPNALGDARLKAAVSGAGDTELGSNDLQGDKE